MPEPHPYTVDCHGCVLWDPTPEDFELMREEEGELAGDSV